MTSKTCISSNYVIYNPPLLSISACMTNGLHLEIMIRRRIEIERESLETWKARRLRFYKLKTWIFDSQTHDWAFPDLRGGGGKKAPIHHAPSIGHCFGKGCQIGWGIADMGICEIICLFVFIEFTSLFFTKYVIYHEIFILNVTLYNFAIALLYSLETFHIYVILSYM